jgi:hypothetical protein
MDLLPIAGVSIEKYYEVLVRARGDLVPDGGAAAAAAAGVAPAWAQARAGWERRLVAAKPKDQREIERRYRAALAAFAGPAPDLPFEAYQEIVVATQVGEPFADALRRHGLDCVSWGQVSYAYMDRLAADKRLNARFVLLCRRDVAAGRSRGWKPRRPKAPKAPDRVRARKCPRCNAFRTSPPQFGWVHCDYCGALFDYDILTPQPAGALDQGDIWQEILGVLDEIGVPDTEAAYAEAKAWAYDLHAEVCSHAYPPRAIDRAWRRKLIDDWLIPIDLAWRREGRLKGLAERLNQQLYSFDHDRPAAADVLALFDAAHAYAEAQADVVDREGIWGRHPGVMDRPLFLRASDAVFVGSWIGRLKGHEADALVAKAWLQSEFVPAPAVALEEAGCGRCRAVLVVPGDANHAVCTSCGAALEPKHRIACRSCNAPLLRVPGVAGLDCAFCGTHYDLS